MVSFKDAANSSQNVPILFVPGAMSGAWIWENNFASFFRSQGYKVHTMSFSGHGSSAAKRLRLSFSNYVDECVAAMSSCDAPPIVIAHSLGGLVALHAATKIETHSLVLLSPVPAFGVLGSMASLAKKSPISVAKFVSAACYSGITKLGTPPLGIYSDTCHPDAAKTVTSQLQSESIPVLMRLLAPPALQKEKLDPEKILFIAAKGDLIIPYLEVIKSARHIGSEAIVYDGLSHTYQVERSWEDIAKDITRWLHNRAPIQQTY
jgi:pimeloyl-ACP methyl ester carboxylesterase